MSLAMRDFKKKLEGDKLKKMMQNGIRASRFTRFSKNGMTTSMLFGQKNDGSAGKTRDTSIMKHTNFDYLGLREESSKLYKKISVFLEKNGENQHAIAVFTDYMYKINS